MVKGWSCPNGGFNFGKIAIAVASYGGRRWRLGGGERIYFIVGGEMRRAREQISVSFST